MSGVTCWSFYDYITSMADETRQCTLALPQKDEKCIGELVEFCYEILRLFLKCYEVVEP